MNLVGSTIQQAEWERDVIAYLNHISDYCRNCMKRHECNECEVNRAKTLLERKKQIGIQHKQLIDKQKDPYSLKARYREIIGILKKAGKPLRTRDIILRTTISRNVKWWTLNRMVSRGLISKTRVKNFYGRYEAAFYWKNRKGERQNENHVVGNHQPQAAQGRQG